MSLKLVITLFLFIYVANATLKLQLNHHESQLQKALKANSMEEYRALKMKHRKEMEQDFSDPAKSKISAYEREVFTVGISVGTPPQSFNAILDTSTTLTRVFSQKKYNNKCMKCLKCGKVPCFDSDASTTYSYIGHKSEIYLGRETISLGDSGQLVVTNVEFGQDVEEPYYFSERGNASGVLGLGLKSESDDIVPVFYKAYQESLIDNPVFTIYLNPQGNLTTPFSGGQLTLGGYDNEHCSLDRIFRLTTKDNAYEFEVDGYGLNGGINTMQKYMALLSSEVTTTHVPYDILDQIIKATGAKYGYNYGVYLVPCDTKFTFSIVINNKSITIDERVGVFKSYNDDACWLTFEAWSSPGVDFVLGTNFMRQWCTTYDVSGLIIFSETIPQK